MKSTLTIAALRTELGLTLAGMADLLGLSSLGHLSQIEREGRCSLPVAIKIEDLSGGRIDAAELNDHVRLARAGVHVDADTDPRGGQSPGNPASDSPCANAGQEAAA